MQGSHANPHAAGSWPLWGALPPQCNTTACVAMALAAGPQASAVAVPPACQQCGTPTHGISCSVANIGNVGPRHHARWAIHSGNGWAAFCNGCSMAWWQLGRGAVWHNLTHGTNRSCGTSALEDWGARPALEDWGGHGHMASKANPNCNVHYVNRLVCGTHTGRVMHMWHVATQCTNAMQQCNTKHSANLYYMTMYYKCQRRIAKPTQRRCGT